MSTHDWADFEEPASSKLTKKEESNSPTEPSPDGGCDWGRGNDGEPAESADCQGTSSTTAKFIELYESYLNDKKSLAQQTSNYKTYMRNPQKELREWFDSEGHEFKLDVDESAPGQFVCSIDVPIDDQDFTLTSEIHSKRSTATEEVCLDACRMLDHCQLLYGEHGGQIGGQEAEEELARKRRITEANKEDDIVFDKTNDAKRCCLTTTNFSHPDGSSSNATYRLGPLNNNVNTYDSLMTRWTALNMSILQSKAKLVKLDLSVTTKRQQNTRATDSQGADNDASGNDASKDTEDNDEIDPLDEFMSSLDTKTKLSMDDKIEKSRLKTQIAEYERQQEEVARLLELAKPSFDSSKLHLGGRGGNSTSKQ
uniref:Kanadaptin n=1 Tax=Aceria tosichella TaxID=561515 RepID=A0A6G1SMH4_9ACAR